jgi:hypothetical protein
MDQLICAINGVYIAYIPINFANFLVDVRQLKALILWPQRAAPGTNAI